ncbi:MAG: flippase [Candidatus Saganbacteria bacterium]|nr:flippase [Candidatus Saganbacteria bacterium]
MTQSATKRIAKNFSWLFVGSVISGTLNFLLIIYLARTLHVAVYGTYSFVQAFLIYLVLLVDSGLSLFGTREIAKEKSQAATVLVNILAVRLIIACLVYFICFFIILLIPMDLYLRWLFLITFLAVFYRALNTEWVFQGIEKMEYMAVARVVFSALSFALVVFLVRGPQDLLIAPAVQFIVGILVSLCLVALLFRRLLITNLKAITPKTWFEIYKKAIPLGASIILIQIYGSLDIIMLGIIHNQEVVGYYNAAYQLFNILVGIFALWQATVLPTAIAKINTDLGRAKLFIDKYLRLTLLVVIPAVAAVFIAAPSLIVLLYGPEYLPGATALRFLVWNLIVIAIGSIYSITILIAAGRYKMFLWAGAIGAGVNIFFNFVLIPPFSFVGAAIATIIAEISAASFSIFWARRILKPSFWPNFIRPLALTFVAFVASLLFLPLLNNLSGLIKPLIVMFIFLTIYGGSMLLVERKFIFNFIYEVVGKCPTPPA